MNIKQFYLKNIIYTDNIYPAVTIKLIENPNKFYAIPLLGGLVKLLSLFPIIIMLFFVVIWWLIAVFLINPFVVLITGRYWKLAYEVNLALLKLNLKISVFLYGLTDKHPGFNFNMPEGISLNIPYPKKPNKLFVIPIGGFLFRFILLFPFLIFRQILSLAVTIGVFLLAWVVVLFKGKYPEKIFELATDSIRVNSSLNMYLTGLSDRYPSFHISLKRDKIKIILLVLSTILYIVFNFFGGS